jgi:hypothetical protein
MYTERRPRTGTQGIHLLRDKAPAHKSDVVANNLQETYLKYNKQDQQGRAVFNERIPR